MLPRMAKVKYNPETDVPDLSGKVILITGGTAGLGKQTILTLAKHHPASIYFTGRDAKRASEVVEEVTAAVPGSKITFLPCDLASLASVSAAAKSFISQSTRLDIVICNAGIMSVAAGVTVDGYEIQFGTNHLGHALLVKLLLPTLLKTAETPDADVRVVFLTSLGYQGHPVGGIRFDTIHTPQVSPILGGWIRYGQSKLANLLYPIEMAKRYPSITSVAVHPGVIITGLVSSMSYLNQALVYTTTMGQRLTLEQGAYNSVWAATVDKSTIKNGAFYEPVGLPGRQIREATNTELAKQLYDWTETELRSWVT